MFRYLDSIAATSQSKQDCHPDRSVPGFPTSPLSLATTFVVLSKENHMQLTEAATLDRKSGVAEGSAVRPSALPNPPYQTLTPKSLSATGTNDN
jgi:hypothetical protein